MRLLTAYISRELLLSFVAVLGVLLLVILGGEVARLLTEALEGRLSPDLVAKLVLLKIPMAMEILLPLSVLLSVMLTFGRLYHDREMEVLAASGIGSRYFLRLVLSMGLIVGLLAGWSSLVASPWAMQQERQLLAEGQMRVQIKALTGGRFTPLSSSNGVFYAEKITPDGRLSEVFIQLRPTDKPDMLLTAPRGHFALDGDRTVLVLEQGQFTEGALGKDRLVVQTFDSMSVWLPDWQVKLSALEVEAMDTLTLWQERDNPKQMAHLEWRFFIGFSVLLMALMGWHLSKVGPRQGRYSRMAFGLGFYLIFTQLAITARAEMQHGSLPPMPGMLVMLLLPMLFWLPVKHWWQKLVWKVST
jgi:lipopolysaccharide export system permease protein